ncbi:MAG: hypothetical protein KGN01_08050, partial [Patescibacteria group bacterium]|nr:hypothetical protein [Patescibacteria group bacterium]
MNFSLVLPTYLYNEKRQQDALRSFASLNKSDFGNHQVSLVIIEKKSQLSTYLPNGSKFANVHIRIPVSPIDGVNQALAFGSELSIELWATDYIVWIFDDMVYNPHWLLELEKLIIRHPKAKAYSVYRSAHEFHHAPLRFEGEDVSVRSLDGMSMCFTPTEWKEWNVNWASDDFTAPTGGNTIDLLHA